MFKCQVQAREWECVTGDLLYVRGPGKATSKEVTQVSRVS